MRTIKEMQARLLYMMLLMLVLIIPTIAQAGTGWHHRHSSDYNFIYYSQPRIYYSRPYYPQLQYNNYLPTLIYGYPSNLIMSISARNMDFMIRF